MLYVTKIQTIFKCLAVRFCKNNSFSVSSLVRLNQSIFLLSYFVYSSSTAQVNPAPFFDRCNLSVHSGFMMPHSESMQHLSKGNFNLYHISVSGQTLGSKTWHHQYNYPVLGFDFLWGNMAYPEVLGSAYAFFPNASFPIFRGSRVKISHQYGLGMAYLTKYFDKDYNYKNNAIGSPFNIALNISTEASVLIYSGIYVNSGISFTHFSNGSGKLPNKGVNIPSVKLGISYLFNNSLVETPTDIKPEIRMPEIYAIFSAGKPSVFPLGSGRHYRFNLNATYAYPIAKKDRVGFGSDIFLGENTSNETPSFVFNPGVFVSWQRDYSKLSFTLANGFYAWDKHNFYDKIIYHRVGFKYNVVGNIMLNLTLKTHFFKAEVIEWGIGYKF
jgi:hypothetical protein